MAQHDMNGQRHAEVDRLPPEYVVRLARVGPPGRPRVQAHSPQPSPGAVPQLCDGVVDAGLWYDPECDEPVAVDRRVLLGEELVVSTDHCAVGIVVRDTAPEAGAAYPGEEHLGVDPVHVLLGNPLLGRASAGRAFVGNARRLEFIKSFSAA